MSLNVEQQKELKKGLEEIANAMTRVSAERDLIKDIKKKLKKNLSLEGKLVNRLAKTFYKKSFDEEVTSDEQFAATYQAVLGK